MNICKRSSSKFFSQANKSTSRYCNANLNYLTRRCYTSLYPKKNNDIKVSLNAESFKNHKISFKPDHTHVNKEDSLAMYKQMFTIRRLELLCDEYYKKKQIWGFCHLYDGQEAVCCGIEAALTKGDHIITAYRDHGFQYTRGDTIRAIFAEMFGKETGCARGKGGSMHLYFPKNNFYGGNGIVGAQVPLGTGIAYGSKYKKDGTVTVAAFGDGAANQGQVFESFNMAALWKLPIIYLVENNRYGMGTATHRASAVFEYYTRGDYIPGIQCDGMNILSVRETFKFATQHCREGKGPVVVEVLTYRYHGHSMSDPGISYRSHDEVQEYRSQFDPIRYLRNIIVEQKWATDEDLKTLEKDIRKQVETEAKEAEQDGMLTEDQLVLDIYSTGPPPFVRYSDYPNSLIDGKTRIKDVDPAHK